MRIDRDGYFLSIAEIASKRSTCFRRAVGCVLVNVHGHILATGYNGVPRGFPHCNESESLARCAGATAAPGEELSACLAIHSEQNALLQCHDVEEIDTAYVTASPCIHCTKLLLNTGCQRIVFLSDYPSPLSKVLWGRAGRFWVKYAA